MKQIYTLDRYTNKNFLVKNVDDETFAKLRAGDKVVYESSDQTGTSKLSIGTYLGHEIATDRQGNFKRILEGEDKAYFEEQQALALDIFPLFKKLFKQSFPDSVPVTARFHIYGDQIYFYFYSEERYVFTDFVKELRQELGKNIFLFQIGARDMVKLSPGTDCIAGCNGISLCCKSSRALPSVEIENIVLQNLEGRDIEKLKGRCGKLKCCLIYELELYTDESKKFPPKGSYVDTKSVGVCGTVFSFNIMNNEVNIRTEDSGTIRIPLAQIKSVTSKPEHDAQTDHDHKSSSANRGVRRDKK
ncbi:MAG: regulatory iron-sulfur-containing complex subunit RicT [candidate division SR1 bacterium]|nr:regulatory iron-sulfur-containing complex subunit RicT [candidate division SR1 bacterium]